MTSNGFHVSYDWETTLTAYALAYGFLNKVFYEAPTTGFIDALLTDDLFTDWPPGSEEEDTEVGLRLLQSFCHTWSDDQLPDLVWDYTRLFVGPGPVLAPPWESVYLSREHLLFDEQTLQVRQMYAQFGLQAPKLNSEPDDHLGLELAFMVHLCSLGLTAAQMGDTEGVQASLRYQRDFLAGHLLRWAPECCKRVMQNANTDFYRGAAHLTLGTLAQAARLLEIDTQGARA